MFRSAFKSRRCVIPASGFYEWTGRARARRFHTISRRATAGPWPSPRSGRAWRDPESDAKVTPATIIVGAANEWMRRFHDRMPIILDWRAAGAWMTGEALARCFARRPELAGPPSYAFTASRAWTRSLSMSANVSRPTEMRTSPSSMP